jgi:hypothetical protein
MLRTISVVVLVLSLAGWVAAQLPTASLGGTVTDPQGAVVPGAKVTITNQGTPSAVTR